MNRCMEVGVCKCSVCELVTGSCNYRAGCVGSSVRSDYDGSRVTRHFADTERSIPSESVRTSASDNWRSVDDKTCR